MKKNGSRHLFFLTLAVPGLLLSFQHPAGGQTVPVPKAARLALRERLAVTGPVADEPALKTLDGQPASWQALRGKAVVVYLWASWCPSCLAGLPELASLARGTDSDKVAVVLLAIDADADQVRAALTTSASPLPVYLAAAPVPDTFAPPSLPAVVVLRPNGQVAAHYEQPGGYDTPAFKAALYQLAQPASH
jgi:thiol-disulfide isomerase/thioredoxin